MTGSQEIAGTQQELRAPEDMTELELLRELVTTTRELKAAIEAFDPSQLLAGLMGGPTGSILNALTGR